MIIFPGLLIYAIVALCVRQKALIEASLCEEHRSVRRKWIAVTWILSLGVLVCIIGGIVLMSVMNNAMWVAVDFAALFRWSRRSLLGIAWVLSLTRMTGDFAWLKGASPDFLSTFPSTGQ